jgi:hypothetical protein
MIRTEGGVSWHSTRSPDPGTTAMSRRPATRRGIGPLTMSLGEAGDVGLEELAAMANGLAGTGFAAHEAADVLPPGPVLGALTAQAVEDVRSLDDDELISVVLPATFAGMAAGTIDGHRAKIIYEYTRFLSGEQAAKADAILAAAAPGMAPAELKQKAARLEYKLDPDGVRQRKEEAARKHRRVEARREESGNARLSGRELDVDEALTAKNSVWAEAAFVRPTSPCETRARVETPATGTGRHALDAPQRPGPHHQAHQIRRINHSRGGVLFQGSAVEACFLEGVGGAEDVGGDGSAGQAARDGLGAARQRSRRRARPVGDPYRVPHGAGKGTHGPEARGCRRHRRAVATGNSRYWIRRIGISAVLVLGLVAYLAMVEGVMQAIAKPGTTGYYALAAGEIVFTLISGVLMFRHLWHLGVSGRNARGGSPRYGRAGAGIGALAFSVGGVLAGLLVLCSLITAGVVLAAFAISLVPVQPNEQYARRVLAEALQLRHQHPGSLGHGAHTTSQRHGRRHKG